MNPRDDKNDPELSCWNMKSDDVIEAKGYKSASMAYLNFHSAMEILEEHGGLVRKFDWRPRKEISSTDLFKILSTMPHLEEIDINCERFLIEIPMPAFDLSRIKTLHCDSEPSFEFFSMLLPANCLKELNMIFVGRSKVDKRIVDRFAQFISTQTSIKAFSTDRKLPLDALSSLTLEKLELRHCCIRQRMLIKVLKKQPDLKSLLYQKKVRVKVFEEACKLSKLESLELYVDEIKDGRNLGKLKNLKELKLYHVLPVNQHKFFTFKLESLEVLNLCDYSTPIHNPEILEAISMNLPSLKFLKLPTTQKLNYFAKIFPNLEELNLTDRVVCWEVDTGIVNEKLRKLSLYCADFCNIGELFFEMFEIYPNLKSLRVDSRYCDRFCEINHRHFTDRKFFAELMKLEKLKSIELHELKLKLDETHLTELAEDLKKLTGKFKFVKISFEDSGKVDPEGALRLVSIYDAFLTDLSVVYKIDEEERSYEEGYYLIIVEITYGMKE